MSRSHSVAWATVIGVTCIVSTSLLDSAAAMTTNGCEPQQGFYLRRDKLDISVYNNSIDASVAEGVAISEADTETAEVHTAWVFARNPCAASMASLRLGGLIFPDMRSRPRFSVTAL